MLHMGYIEESILHGTEGILSAITYSSQDRIGVYDPECVSEIEYRRYHEKDVLQAKKLLTSQKSDDACCLDIVFGIRNTSPI